MNKKILVAMDREYYSWKWDMRYWVPCSKWDMDGDRADIDRNYYWVHIRHYIWDKSIQDNKIRYHETNHLFYVLLKFDNKVYNLLDHWPFIYHWMYKIDMVVNYLFCHCLVRNFDVLVRNKEVNSLLVRGRCKLDLYMA